MEVVRADPSRGERGWEQREARVGEHATVAEPALAIAVDELYAGIDLTAGE